MLNTPPGKAHFSTARTMACAVCSGCHMSGMSLNHHRAAGRQRRGGIAAGGRKGQRKVAGAEYRHRAKRHLILAQIRSR
jgi:hypothetical protein